MHSGASAERTAYALCARKLGGTNGEEKTLMLAHSSLPSETAARSVVG